MVSGGDGRPCLQVHYYTEALPTRYGYCVGVSHWRATGNCEWRTCPRSLRGLSWIRTLSTKGVDSTSGPSHPTKLRMIDIIYLYPLLPSGWLQEPMMKMIPVVFS